MYLSSVVACVLLQASTIQIAPVYVTLVYWALLHTQTPCMYKVMQAPDSANLMALEAGAKNAITIKEARIRTKAVEERQWCFASRYHTKPLRNVYTISVHVYL